MPPGLTWTLLGKRAEKEGQQSGGSLALRPLLAFVSRVARRQSPLMFPLEAEII